MMAQKAVLFDDLTTYQKVVKCTTPGEAKSLGREVDGFNQATWDKAKFDIVVTGNFHQFSQNQFLMEYRLNTQNRFLVEASPVDTVLGIGLSKDDSAVHQPTLWQGQNLLGFALMEVRDQLRSR